jgi:hypothetical protein
MIFDHHIDLLPTAFVVLNLTMVTFSLRRLMIEDIRPSREE